MYGRRRRSAVRTAGSIIPEKAVVCLSAGRSVRLATATGRRNRSGRLGKGTAVGEGPSARRERGRKGTVVPATG